MEKGRQERSAVELAQLEAVIFDLDGVVTDTATTHAAAWKQLFDELLRRRADAGGEPFRPFDIDGDYRRFIDGKPRYDGVESFLESRAISLPRGDPADSPEQETVCGLGNRKNDYFLARLETEGVKAFESTVRLLRALRDQGLRTAIISASRNCGPILEAAGIRSLFEVKVDGIDSDELGLKGKPDPAIFLEAARRLRVEPSRAAVVEDALAGVEAGRRGKFRLVVGVDRTGHAAELADRGADLVVRDLGELELVGSERVQDREEQDPGAPGDALARGGL